VVLSHALSDNAGRDDRLTGFGGCDSDQTASGSERGFTGEAGGACLSTRACDDQHLSDIAFVRMRTAAPKP